MRISTNIKCSIFFKAFICLLLSTFILALPLTQAQATSTKSKIYTAKTQAKDAREKLDELSTKLELATEDYEEAEQAVKSTEADIFDINIKLKKAQQKLDNAQQQLNDRAASIYRQDSLSIVDVVLGADNFTDLVTRLDLMQRLSQQDNELLISVRSAKAEISAAKTDLEQKRLDQADAQKKFAQKKNEAESLYAEQAAYLQSLNSTIKKLIEQERKEIAEQQEREAKAAAAASNSSSGGSGNVSGARDFDASALGGAHSEVVSIAMKFVGKTPYVWGGTSPSGFDCSGLTQYCYAKIGISIPRTSRSQYTIGAFIPANRTDLLQPGDLLFFGYGRSASRIHHVAIYAGGGKMIHAPQTGMKVSVTYLSGRSDYVGAVRP